MESLPATDIDIADLGLPSKGRASLAVGGMRTVSELLELSEFELLSLPNFGRKSLTALKEALAARGLRLAAAPPARPP
jgi:DNA-directed RNA polymerase alpha subunit